MERCWINEDPALADQITARPAGNSRHLALGVHLVDCRYFVVCAVIALALSFVAGATEPAGAAESAANVDAARTPTSPINFRRLMPADATDVRFGSFCDISATLGDV
jgi:hypothetical protein